MKSLFSRRFTGQRKKKIHKQFDHSSAGSFKMIIHNRRRINLDLSKIIDNAISQGEVCKNYRKPRTTYSWLCKNKTFS